jgi:late competence protein required for DNA uptake (superfamily II DNA/RNA helicase)
LPKAIKKNLHAAPKKTKNKNINSIYLTKTKQKTKTKKQKQKQSSTSFEPGRQRPETCSFSRVRGELKNLNRIP